MQRKILLATLVLAVVWAGIGFSEAIAQQQKVKDFYKGKVLQFVCPYGPGGGYDAWIRTLAIPLQKYTGARVLVKNMPGGSGLMASSYLFNVAKPNGLAIALLAAPGMTLGEMLQYETIKLAKYKLQNFTAICRIEHQIRGLIVGAPSGFRSLMDMKNSTKPVRFAFTDPTSDAAAEAALVAEAFDFKAKMIAGWKSSGEYWLSIMAGRGADASFVAIRRMKGYMEKGDLFPIVVLSRKRMSDFPQVPTLLESPGLNPEKRKYAELAMMMHEPGRAILAPPGVPAERAAFLEKAILASLKEPSVVSWAKKRGFSIDPLPGKGLRKVISKTMEMVPPSERKKVKDIITKKYY
jgi:tripartite-type tricarboxylate transporter receptor subunit TctC